MEDSICITTYENQPIEEFAKEVAELVKKEWGSHNIDPFIEAFNKEVEDNGKVL